LSYILNRQWSFNDRGGHRVPREALLFVIINAIAFGINLIPLATTHNLMSIRVSAGYSRLTVGVVDWLMANVVGTYIAMFFRYWGYRKYVFPQDRDNGTSYQRM